MHVKCQRAHLCRLWRQQGLLQIITAFLAGKFKARLSSATLCRGLAKGRLLLRSRRTRLTLIFVPGPLVRGPPGRCMKVIHLREAAR